MRRPIGVAALGERAEVWRVGRGTVDLRAVLLAAARARRRCACSSRAGARRTGPSSRDDLVDELHVTIAPALLGGRDAPTLLEGTGFCHGRSGARLRLASVRREGDELYLPLRGRALVARAEERHATTANGAAGVAGRDRRARAAHRRGAPSAYPDADCALRHANALELLVATILSAQCTDERVNQVTPALFRAFPTPRRYAARRRRASSSRTIRSTGFFRNKARSLIGLGRALVERHGGEVPDRMEDLVQLPGVGRKTANVVLGTWFGQPAIPVDTHVTRVAQPPGADRAKPIR